ncbi:MAG: GTP 3',8-cyclase MoaA [Leptothrix sp. (in: Bacteria)]|nr:GTP 3',8-cyclase MoaA [Leptothrix sp. (in: b-proteobacteria)]
MTLRVFPIHIERPYAASSVLLDHPPDHQAGDPLRDRLARPFTDLRISVTDRCNFRCVYCMPRTAFGPGHAFLPHAALLSFEELARLARLFAGLGMRKLRITGGEPLMRKDLPQLIGMLSAMQQDEGPPFDIAMTTNGSLLARHAAALKAAGLRRVTVSLDALDPKVFRTMSDTETPVDTVLEGIHQAHAAGLGPVKVNMVVRRGHNDRQILPMAEYFSRAGMELRFIEYMDVGSTNGWRTDEVTTAKEILAVLRQRFDLVPLPRESGDTAMRFIDRASGARFGIIASITSPFCGDCTRLRLSSDGQLHTCLFGANSHDLRARVRRGDDDEALRKFVARLWQERGDRYSEARAHHLQAASTPRAEMSYIGG